MLKKPGNDGGGGAAALVARGRPEVEARPLRTEGLEKPRRRAGSWDPLIRLAKGDEAAERGVGSVAGGGAAPRPRNQLPPHSSSPLSGLVPRPRTAAPGARFATNGRHRRTTATDQNHSIQLFTYVPSPPLFAQHLRAPWLEIPHQLVLATVRPTV